MFKKMCLALVSACVFAGAAYSQPERAVDRASDHIIQEPVKKNPQVKQKKVSRLSNEIANENQAPKEKPRRISVKAPNGLR